MSIKNYHYDYKDIKGMKELIRTGRPLLQIAREEHERYGATLAGFYAKLQKLAKTTTKIRKWEGPKKIRRTKAEMAAAMPNNPQQPMEEAGVTVPEGTTFEVTPKKVVIYSNHLRVYF